MIFAGLFLAAARPAAGLPGIAGVPAFPAVGLIGNDIPADPVATPVDMVTTPPAAPAVKPVRCNVCTAAAAAGMAQGTGDAAFSAVRRIGIPVGAMPGTAILQDGAAVAAPAAVIVIRQDTGTDTVAWDLERPARACRHLRTAPCAS